jgi:SHS2 domain-containing protein
MKEPEKAGYQEIEHTADWQLKAWAVDIPHLFEQAALGMYDLSGVQLAPEPRVTQDLSLDAPDREILLVDFLSELLYLGETENLGFDDFDLQVEDAVLHAKIKGATIQSQTKEIKAVTYHNLKIEKGPDDVWEVNIVFDV